MSKITPRRGGYLPAEMPPTPTPPRMAPAAGRRPTGKTSLGSRRASWRSEFLEIFGLLVLRKGSRITLRDDPMKVEMFERKEFDEEN